MTGGRAALAAVLVAGLASGAWAQATLPAEDARRALREAVSAIGEAQTLTLKLAGQTERTFTQNGAGSPLDPMRSGGDLILYRHGDSLAIKDAPTGVPVFSFDHRRVVRKLAPTLEQVVAYEVEVPLDEYLARGGPLYPIGGPGDPMPMLLAHDAWPRYFQYLENLSAARDADGLLRIEGVDWCGTKWAIWVSEGEAPRVQRARTEAKLIVGITKVAPPADGIYPPDTPTDRAEALKTQELTFQPGEYEAPLPKNAFELPSAEDVNAPSGVMAPARVGSKVAFGRLTGLSGEPVAESAYQGRTLVGLVFSDHPRSPERVPQFLAVARTLEREGLDGVRVLLMFSGSDARRAKELLGDAPGNVLVVKFPEEIRDALGDNILFVLDPDGVMVWAGLPTWPSALGDIISAARRGG